MQLLWLALAGLLAAADAAQRDDPLGAAPPLRGAAPVALASDVALALASNAGAERLAVADGTSCDQTSYQFELRNNFISYRTMWRLYNECTGQLVAEKGWGGYGNGYRGSRTYMEDYCLPNAEYRFEVMNEH